MFKDYFSKNDEKFKIETKTINEAKDINDTIADIRKKVKVKNVIPTRFGVEVILFNNNDAKEAAKIAGTKDIEDTSIFIKG